MRSATHTLLEASLYLRARDYDTETLHAQAANCVRLRVLEARCDALSQRLRHPAADSTQPRYEYQVVLNGMMKIDPSDEKARRPARMGGWTVV